MELNAPPAQATPPEISTLAELAEAIRKHHGAVAGHFRHIFDHALAAGDALIAAKRKVAHGGWADWIENNCEINERTAQRYMQIARARPEIEANPTSVTDLSLAGVIKLISRRGDRPEPEIKPPMPTVRGDQAEISAEDRRATFAAMDEAPSPTGIKSDAAEAKSADGGRPARKSRFNAEHYAETLARDVDLLDTTLDEYPDRFEQILDHLLGNTEFIGVLAELARHPKVEAVIDAVAAKLGGARGRRDG
jgi:hypothetical protein